MSKQVHTIKTEFNNFNHQTTGEVVRRLIIAREYIAENFNKPLTLEEISQKACMSVTHFLRTFRNEYDCSPHQYHIQLRLQHSRYLLLTTDYSINKIVNLLGLVCVSTFIELFKKEYHITPAKFRILKN